MRIEIRPSGKRFTVTAIAGREAIPLSPERMAFAEARELACEASRSGPFEGWPVINTASESRYGATARARNCMWALA